MGSKRGASKPEAPRNKNAVFGQWNTWTADCGLQIADRPGIKQRLRVKRILQTDYRCYLYLEIQRVHRSGKGKDGEPRPILTCFLRYKDAQKIFSLGHRLKYTDYQMFPDYPAEIVKRRKEQMKTFKEARKNGIPEAFSPSQPDKLYIRGRLWPVGRELTFS